MSRPRRSTDPQPQESTGAFRITPVPRKRGADLAFDVLARAILSGELPPGSALPPQREIAERFDISTLVIRQAIHKLEDVGLLRVRQGSPAFVLDPEKATDIRLLQLRLELAPAGKDMSADAAETRMLFMVPMLILAERRITKQQLGVLEYLVESLGSAATPEEGLKFRLEYWRQIAKATHNELIHAQMRWWLSFARDLRMRGQPVAPPPTPTERGFYGALTKALAERKGAVDLYLRAITPMLERFDAQRAKDAPESG
jgi:DNA-binding FadR family transcriptional regulator